MNGIIVGSGDATCTCTFRAARTAPTARPHLVEVEVDSLCPVHAPPRIKLACINAGAAPDAPRALTYLHVGRGAWNTAYHRTWDDAVRWLDERAERLSRAAWEIHKRLRNERDQQ